MSSTSASVNAWNVSKFSFLNASQTSVTILCVDIGKEQEYQCISTVHVPQSIRDPAQVPKSRWYHTRSSSGVILSEPTLEACENCENESSSCEAALISSSDPVGVEFTCLWRWCSWGPFKPARREFWRDARLSLIRSSIWLMIRCRHCFVSPTPWALVWATRPYESSPWDSPRSSCDWSCWGCVAPVDVNVPCPVPCAWNVNACDGWNGVVPEDVVVGRVNENSMVFVIGCEIVRERRERRFVATKNKATLISPPNGHVSQHPSSDADEIFLNFQRYSWLNARLISCKTEACWTISQFIQGNSSSLATQSSWVCASIYDWYWGLTLSQYGPSSK